MVAALKAALADAELTESDAAAVYLARLHARAIDADPEKALTHGPKLAAILTALGLTPAGRRAAPRPADGLPAPGPVEEGTDRERALAAIRARRAERTTPR